MKTISKFKRARLLKEGLEKLHRAYALLGEIEHRLEQKMATRKAA